MANKIFIVKHRKGAQVPRLIEASSTRKVEDVILRDFDIVAVKATNATELAEHVTKGIKIEAANED